MLYSLLNKIRNWFNPKMNNDLLLDDTTTILNNTYMTSSMSTGIITGNAISSITITNAGSGYMTPPIATLSSSGTFGLGGQAWAGSNVPHSQTMTIQNELIIQQSDGKSIKVAETLSNIIDIFGLLQPDKNLISKYPALQNAWDEYKSELTRSLKSPELISAIDSYNMTVSLIKAAEGEQ